MRALVTGAASGIGRATVKRLVRDGHEVFATDVNEDGMAAAADADRWPERVTRAQLDVREADQWREVFARAVGQMGYVDLCMNVAGVLDMAWVHEIEDRHIDFMIDVNVKGVMFGTRTATAHMVERRAGHVINVASLAALGPVPGLSIYSATKYAVRAFSLAAAIELREHGVAVTTVCPDAVETPMLVQQEGAKQAELTFSGKRALTAQEVADAMCGPVIQKRPMEVALPFDRGVLAKVANLAPDSARILWPLLRRQGAANQKARKR